MSWCDLSNELLNDITQHVEVADVIRSEAVCTEWRSGIRREYYCKSNVPWLMFSSSDDDKINYRYFYSLIEHKIYKVCLPDIAGQHCVGSSHGYLISVDDNADLIATNPLAGGTHISLPPTSALPDVAFVIRDDSGQIIEYEVNRINLLDPNISETEDLKQIRDHHYRKVILSPDAGTVVAIHGENGWLAFSHVGDQSWSRLENPTIRDFDDMIFHKARLYAINFMGTIAIFNLDCPLEPHFVSQWGPVKEMDGQPRRYLIESPDGSKLFLVLKIFDDDEDGIPRTESFTVYLLDETTYTWNQIMDLGEIALFVGFNYSTSLYTHGCTGIKRNCIYFTDDDKDYYIRHPENAGYTGVFNLEDGRIEQVFSDKELKQLNWPPPIWFMPILSCVS